MRVARLNIPDGVQIVPAAVPSNAVHPTQTRTNLPPKLRWKKEHPLPSNTRGIQK